MDDKVLGLSPEQRAERYRALAKEAMDRAGKAKLKSAHNSFVQIAGHWYALALEAEAIAPKKRP